jgi:hypothetical protein
LSDLNNLDFKNKSINQKKVIKLFINIFLLQTKMQQKQVHRAELKPKSNQPTGSYI